MALASGACEGARVSEREAGTASAPDAAKASSIRMSCPSAPRPSPPPIGPPARHGPGCSAA